MKAKSVWANLDRLGNTALISLLVKPNHLASVAAYWSTDIVGIIRPTPISSSELSEKSQLNSHSLPNFTFAIFALE
jgi:hypothetical protein